MKQSRYVYFKNTYVNAEATTEALHPLRQYKHNNAVTTPHI